MTSLDQKQAVRYFTTLLTPVSYFASHLLFMAVGFISGILAHKAGRDISEEVKETKKDKENDSN